MRRTDAPPTPPARAAAPVAWRLVPWRSPCRRLVAAMPAAGHTPRPSAARGMIRPEARATRPVQRQPVVQFLEPVSCRPADKRRHRRRRALAQIGHHTARIAFGVPPRQPDHLGLDDDASAMRPGLGRIRGSPRRRAWCGRCTSTGRRPRPAGARRAAPAAGCWPAPRHTRPARLPGRPASRSRQSPRPHGPAPGPGNAPRSRRSRVRRRPTAPRLAGLLPGRRTIATSYCSASSLNVSVATSGR